MSQLEFHLDANWANLAKRLKSLNHRRILEQAVTDVAAHVHNKAATYPPPPENSSYKRTGTLGRKITHTAARTSGKTVSATVGVKLSYAFYVEEGTGLYGPKRRYITPVTAKRLAWVATAGPSAGQWMRAKRVRGMQPWHFMRNAFDGSQVYALNRYRRAFLDIDRAAGG